MKYFSAFLLSLLALCQCVGQIARIDNQSTASYSESSEFTSQLGAYFEADKTIKVERYSLPVPKTGEEVATGPITLSVTVLDANARPVTDLIAKDFSVTLQEVDCKLDTVETVKHPLHVILLLDLSYSSGSLLRVMRENTKALIRRLSPESVVSVATFSLRLKFRAEKMRDKALAENEIEKIREFEDGTSLYDALTALAKNPALNGHDTVVVLLTDGIDTTSRGSIRDSLVRVEQAKATIYPVYLDSFTEYLKSRPKPSGKPSSSIVLGLGRVMNGPPEPTREDSEIGKMYLNDIASLSGGRPVVASYVDGEAPFGLEQEMSSKYLLTCSPSTKYHLNQRLRVKVRVGRSGLLVLTRSNFVVSK